ncbi:MAG: hypothetical protein LBL32_02605 [Holosporales bacterium]|nr:hypothetical protein [Holosporales bacterium]
MNNFIARMIHSAYNMFPWANSQVINSQEKRGELAMIPHDSRITSTPIPKCFRKLGAAVSLAIMGFPIAMAATLPQTPPDSERRIEPTALLLRHNVAPIGTVENPVKWKSEEPIPRSVVIEIHLIPEGNPNYRHQRFPPNNQASAAFLHACTLLGIGRFEFLSKFQGKIRSLEEIETIGNGNAIMLELQYDPDSKTYVFKRCFNSGSKSTKAIAIPLLDPLNRWVLFIQDEHDPGVFHLLHPPGIILVEFPYHPQYHLLQKDSPVLEEWEEIIPYYPLI